MEEECCYIIVGDWKGSFPVGWPEVTVDLVTPLALPIKVNTCELMQKKLNALNR